jgi:glycosyltransferase involved in cell wall biosynthesis
MMVSPYSYPKMGGVERYSYELGMKVKEKFGHEVVFVSSSWDKQTNQRSVTENEAKIYKMPYLFKISSTPINPFWASELDKIIEIEKPDIINGHTPVPYIADVAARVARKKKIPYILTYHSDLTDHTLQARMFTGPYNAMMGTKTLEMADLIIATSARYVKQSEMLNGFEHKIKLVPPGVDTDVFKRNRTGSLQRKLNLTDEKVILFVGQLNRASKHKGLHDLLLAVQNINRSINVRLVVAGKGDYTEHYRQFAKQIGIENNVHFVGYVPNEDLASFYSDGDVLVLPSVDQTEGFGMVLTEAQACGVPVIGTNVGGIPAAVDDGRTGLIVPPSDVSSLSKALIRILGDNAYSSNLGRNGTVWVSRQFSWDVVSTNYNDHVLEVLRR